MSGIGAALKTMFYGALTVTGILTTLYVTPAGALLGNLPSLAKSLVVQTGLWYTIIALMLLIGIGMFLVREAWFIVVPIFLIYFVLTNKSAEKQAPSDVRKNSEVKPPISIAENWIRQTSFSFLDAVLAFVLAIAIALWLWPAGCGNTGCEPIQVAFENPVSGLHASFPKTFTADGFYAVLAILTSGLFVTITGLIGLGMPALHRNWWPGVVKQRESVNEPRIPS